MCRAWWEGPRGVGARKQAKIRGSQTGLVYREGVRRNKGVRGWKEMARRGWRKSEE